MVYCCARSSLSNESDRNARLTPLAAHSRRASNSAGHFHRPTMDRDAALQADHRSRRLYQVRFLSAAANSPRPSKADLTYPMVTKEESSTVRSSSLCVLVKLNGCAGLGANGVGVPLYQLDRLTLSSLNIQATRSAASCCPTTPGPLVPCSKPTRELKSRTGVIQTTTSTGAVRRDRLDQRVAELLRRVSRESWRRSSRPKQPSDTTCRDIMSSQSAPVRSRSFGEFSGPQYAAQLSMVPMPNATGACDLGLGIKLM